MKKLLYTFLAVSIIFSACKKEENNSSNSFSGNWSGIYWGEESGTWVGTVTSDGDFVNGIITSENNDIYFATGSVTNSGSFEVTIGTVTSGAVFTGNANGNIVQGEWVNSSEVISGEWSGTKQ